MKQNIEHLVRRLLKHPQGSPKLAGNVLRIHGSGSLNRDKIWDFGFFTFLGASPQRNPQRLEKAAGERKPANPSKILQKTLVWAAMTLETPAGVPTRRFWPPGIDSRAVPGRHLRFFAHFAPKCGIARGRGFTTYAPTVVQIAITK